MSLRTTLTVTAAAAILLAAAGAMVAITSNSSSADDATTATASATAPAGPYTYAADDAGTVTVDDEDGVLTFASIKPAAGWVSKVEVPRGRQIEVTFTNGDRIVDFKAELENGHVHSHVREDTSSDRADGPSSDDRRGDDDYCDDRSSSDRSGDDRSGDDRSSDDRSGHGGGDDDHDSSGRDHYEDD